ncbi:hypothetical protein UA00_00326 [Streptococcus gordonii]|nr:hypothetical protein UA00_00326 [Streptococcus gordonii]
MKSNKLLLVNGITSILGGFLILYASSERWDWKIVDLVPKLVENYGWGGLVVLISLLFLALSIVGMLIIAKTQESIRPVISFSFVPLLLDLSLFWVTSLAFYL